MDATAGQAATPRRVLDPAVEARIAAFVACSAFSTAGGMVTDLDGTVVFETRGRVLLAPEVEAALAALYALGRPLMINSLRFPLSVLRSFAADWYRLSRAPIPTVSLNGSQIGLVHVEDGATPRFEEIAAFPLLPQDIAEVMPRIEALLSAGADEFLLFRYPRDWRQGEIVWTPHAPRIPALVARYPSAARVESGPVDALRRALSDEPHCMLVLLVDAPEDRLMAYQHVRGARFFTHAGVDKLTGATALASHLGMDLRHSIGAGDTEMDRFLAGVGLALHVGPHAVVHRGIVDTIRLRDAGELAGALSSLVTLERARIAAGVAPPPPRS